MVWPAEGDRTAGCNNFAGCLRTHRYQRRLHATGKLRYRVASRARRVQQREDPCGFQWPSVLWAEM